MFQRNFLLLLLVCSIVELALCQEDENDGVKGVNGTTKEEERKKRLFPAFQFIKFPNDNCDGGSRNGTCFTADECNLKAGTSSGSCANGFGVCCVFTLGCGSTTSYNISYLVQGAANSISSPCQYKICQANPAVCRFRLDFTSFTIAGPNTAKVLAVGDDTASSLATGIGHCVTDSFSVSAPGSKGSPVICGVNSGQHMIIDAGNKGTCLTALFQIAAATSVARSWDIKVTQYDCGDQSGGPQGCLQYFTGVSNKFASFNFPLTATTVTSTFTHLANQNYDICIRRESGFCFICYIPSISNAIAANSVSSQNSFGLSNTNINIITLPADAASGTNADCTSDYLSIPGGNDRSRTLLLNLNPAVQRVCGRQFDSNGGTLIPASVCSKSAPFKVTFVTDGTEVHTDATADTSVNEEYQFPGGSIGFFLSYTQLACGTSA